MSSSHLTRGPLSVRNSTVTLPSLADCLARVETSDVQRFTTQGEAATVEARAGSICVTNLGTDLRPELRWYVAPDDEARAVRLWVEVQNTTGRGLPIERIDVLVAPTGFREVAASELEVAQTGWQSWSYATPPVPLAEQPRVSPPVFGPILPPTEDERTLLPWMTLLREPGGGSLLLGFITARSQTGIIAVQPDLPGHRITASAYAEGVVLPPGETMRSETLLLVLDRPEAEALEMYARELGANMGARKWPHVPTGWCSWYQFFTEVTEDDILRNLDHLARVRANAPLEYVQIDDGYQAEVGDWLAVNDKFPGGMRALAERIRERGFKPGIWLAPFLAHERSRVFTEHPDWIVRDGAGEPLMAMHNWGGNNYALDTTHPEVEQWLRRVIRTMTQEWGYDYLKIDFIYAAALRGRRHDPTRTGVEAYRRGLEIIREEAGDRFVLGCGAPFAPAVGLVDGMRIGPDVAPYWRGVEKEDGFARGLHRAVRSTLAHLWMHGHLWANDPDCLMLRERDSDLTLAEVQAWTSLVALSGGMVLLSDDMALLEAEPERAEMLARALPPSGITATALGPVVDGIASRAQLVVERDWGRRLVAALFNWSDQPQEAAFDPAEWAMPGEPYHLYDLWSGEHFGPVRGLVSLGTIAPHGVRLLAVHADVGRPQLLGTTLHLLGGVVELSSESWSGDALTLRFDCPGEREGRLAVYVPPGFRPGGITEVEIEPNGSGSIHVGPFSSTEMASRGGVLPVAVSFTESAVVKLKSEREETPT
jgi:alpha-galactosidase